MTKVQLEASPQTREAVEARYGPLGYTVFWEPKPNQLPSALREIKNFRPDAIAKKNHEFIIIEIVRPNASGNATPIIRKASQLLETVENWTLEAFILPGYIDDRKNQNQSQLRENFDQLCAIKDVSPSAALVGLWGNLEAQARSKWPFVSDKYKGPRGLIDNLEENFQISEIRANNLRKISFLRNEIAHGYFVEPEEVKWANEYMLQSLKELFYLNAKSEKEVSQRIDDA